MTKKSFVNDIWLIGIIFLVSRIILSFFGVSLDYTALFKYWQYLDAETLQHNLLRGIWFDHTQPPVFNLLLGTVLKLTGSYAPFAFAFIFKLITLINTLLLFTILKRSIQHKYLPLLFALLYLLSPATMIFENELFYTTFISLMLLTSCYFLQNLQQKVNWKNATGLFLPLAIICLTRSLYHIVWLLFLSLIVLIYYKKKTGFSTLATCAVLSLLLVSSWYIKNHFVFNSYSVSSWTGMNIARNVFHDAETADSSKIESIEPFSKISAYKKFIPADFEKKYTGLNDRDLLNEMKNDSFINEKNINYIKVSSQYMAASRQYVKDHPFAYLKNAMQSAIIFFAPATRYPTTEAQAKKIKYYDLVYSFNPSHFVKGKKERRIALTVSAIPKFILYLVVFFLVFRNMIRQKKIVLIHLFITGIIGYIFCVSSFFEHYENMRFRYEAEPLFLILFASVLVPLLKKTQKDNSGIKQSAI